MTPQKKRLLLTDLDGTIRTTLSGNKFINDPFDQKAIDKTQQKLDSWFNDGVRICGITNQAGVFYGHKSFRNCLSEQLRSLYIFPELTSIYFCPDMGESCYKVFRISSDRCSHTKYDQDTQWQLIRAKANFRKPDPGMLILAAKEQGYEDFYEQILYIGDRPEDEAAAKNAGIDFQWLKIFLKDENIRPHI